MYLKYLCCFLSAQAILACSAVDSSNPKRPAPPSTPSVATPSVIKTGTSEKIIFSGDNIPVLPQLGLSFPGSNPNYYGYMTDAGIGTVRISASWKQIEPRKGRYNWSGLDRRIIGLQNLGIDPFVTFESNAEWATTASSFNKVKNATPKSIEVWDGFITAVVERYNADGQNDAPGLKRPVRWYQAANEWISDTNRSGGWAGTPQQLITYVNTAQSAVKRSDPNANFVMGGIASTNLDLLVNALKVDRYTVQQYSNEGRLRVFKEAEIEGPLVQDALAKLVRPVLQNTRYDYLDLHLYGPETRDPERVKAIQNIAKPAPILTSECGGPSLDYSKTSYKPEDHFFAVIHRNLMIQSLDMPFCLWFQLGETDGATWGNEKTALFDRNKQPKPGYMGYKVLATLLENASSVEDHSNDQRIHFVIRRQNSSPINVQWRTDRQPLRRADIENLSMNTTKLIGNINSGETLEIWPYNASAPTYIAIESENLPAAFQ